MIYSQNGAQRGIVNGHYVNGQIVYQTTYLPLSPEQNKEMAYLIQWSYRISDVI